LTTHSDGEENTMTETQPGREPEQGAGPENEMLEQVEQGTGYADPGAQIGLSAREPTDDLSPTGYLDPGSQTGLGTREPTDVHGQAREVAESSEGPGSAETPGA
jgi:hypothetical protein